MISSLFPKVLKRGSLFLGPFFGLRPCPFRFLEEVVLFFSIMMTFFKTFL
jgi:hypothetical protein